MSKCRKNLSMFMSQLIRILECRFWNPRRRFDYEVLGRIEDPMFNKVYRCLKRDGDNERIGFAIKEIFVPLEDAWPLLDKKISSLQKLQHGNVFRLLDAFRREQCLYLVYEYPVGNLIPFITVPIRDKNPLYIKHFLHQIITGVAYCHSQGIIHGDLKPQNIIIDFNFPGCPLIKLADFGLARVLYSTGLPKTVDDREYRAPELVLGFNDYSKEADMWSVGCIFGEMLTGQTLFRGKSKEDQLRKMFSLLGTPTEDSWPGRDLAVKFPNLDPEGLDLLSKMLCLAPHKRISAKDALKHSYMVHVPTVVVERDIFHRQAMRKNNVIIEMI